MLPQAEKGLKESGKSFLAAGLKARASCQSFML